MRAYYLTGYFLVPFFLFAGISLQAVGFYVFILLLPFLYFSQGNFWVDKGVLKRLGFILVILWGLYPLSNIINYFISPVDLNYWQLPALWNKKILFSKLPSSFLMSGLFFVFLSKKMEKMNFDKSRGSRTQAAPSRDFISYFFKGLAYASLLLFAYLIFQHITGYDIRRGFGYKAMNNFIEDAALFRVVGFFGHPLTLASVSLAHVGMLGSLLYIRQEKKEKLGWIGAKESAKFLWISFLCNIFFLFMSGGRTALFIAVIYGVMALAYLLFKQLSWRKSLAIGGVSLSILSFLFYQTGIFIRFLEISDRLKEKGWMGIGRFVFWHVHARIIQDYPWIGRGAYFMSNGERTRYYDLLGYQDFFEKYNAHNIFIESLADIGFLGSLMTLFLLYFLYVLLFRLAYTALSRSLLIGLIVAFSMNFMHGLTQNTFHDSSVVLIYLVYMWLFIWSAFCVGNTNYVK